MQPPPHTLELETWHEESYYAGPWVCVQERKRDMGIVGIVFRVVGQ